MQNNIYDLYFREDKINKELCELSKRIPLSIIKTEGTSCFNKKILSITVGRINSPSVFVMSGCHGTEWPGVLCALRFLNEFAQKLDGGDICGLSPKYILNNRRLLFLPLVNPDGMEYTLKSGVYWQANAVGVDINHNYDADFNKGKQKIIAEGICKPGPTKWPGNAPESEPETQITTEIVRRENFNICFSFHSQGEVIYYSGCGKIPKDSRCIVSILSAVSGYSSEIPDGTAGNGGFTDWFIQEYSRPSFTVELGSGKNPLPFSDFDAIYEAYKKILCAGIMLAGINF